MMSRVVLFFSSFSRVLRSFTPWAVGILIIGLTIAGLMGKFAQKTEAAWYDDLFAYRRAIRFGNTGATVTDQKVLIAMNTSSTSGLIQDERMQTDCDDTRFTDANGRALQYFIDVNGGAGVGCNDTSTDYYVLMPRIEGGGDTLIYMYYGNYNAVSASAAANFSQATFTPTSGPSTAAEEAGTAPLLYWNLDEGYGTTADDLTIQRNNGTITGSWTTEDRCVSGKCLQFNGSSHKVIKTYASDFELDVSSNSFTVSLWMRHASALAGTDTLVSRVSSGGYKIAASSGSFCFAIDDDAAAFDPDDSACTSSTYNDSLWHQVTAVKNGTTSITLYVDGNQVAQDASLTGTGSLSGSSPELDIGVDGASNYFDGAIDEVKVYNTAKTASQIKAEYSSRSATGEGTSSVAGTNTIPSLSNGLVGYWRMDEPGQNDCDGTNDTCDVSGNINHGAWTNNAITTGGGKFGRAVWFDGTTDYVSVADSTSLSVTTQLSLGLWINSSSSVASESLVVKNNSYRLVTDANSNPVCQVSDGTTWQTAATSSTALTTSTWYHVGCSYDGQTIRVFVNGVETGRNALASSIGDNANALEFGRDAGGTYTDFGGVLDEVRLYNRALSPNDMAQLFTFGPGPVGWWKLDENTGVNPVDSSGNGYNLTTNGTPTWVTGKFGSTQSFKGSTDDWLAVTDKEDLSMGTGKSITTTAWVYPTSITTEVAYGKGTATVLANLEYEMRIVSNKFDFIVSDCISSQGEAIANSFGTVTANQWYFVVGSYNASTQTVGISVNGGPIDTVSFNSSNCNTTKEFVVGARPDQHNLPWFGQVDDVRIYNYARTGKQIVEDMLGGRSSVTSGGPNAGQVVYWEFDEGQGTTANNAVEEPGTGSLDGTITGAAWTLDTSAATCKLNGCLRFDTTTDNVSAGDALFTDGLSAMTTTLWFNTNTLSTSGAIVSKSGFGANSSFAITTGSTNTELRVFIASSTSSDANYFTTTDFSMTTSSWTHVAVVYDGGLAAADRVKVYNNGRPVRGSVTGTIPTTLVSTSTANLKAGASDAAGYTALNALFDEVKMYSGALTPSEVLVDMNAGSAAAMGGVLGTHDSEGFSGNPPVGWWKMDENTGTTANDSSGNGNNGSITNALWKPGKYGSGFGARNSGAANQLNVVTISDPASGLLDFSNTQDFTVETWIFSTAKDSSIAPINKGATTNTNDGYDIEIDSSQNAKCKYTDGDGSGDDRATGTPAIGADGLWHHIVCVMDRDGSEIGTAGYHIFIDGRLEASDTSLTEGSAASNTTNLTIGATGNNLEFDGATDEVKIYDYARTKAQVAYDYNRGGPVGYWQFDECQGQTAFDASADASGVTLDTSGGMSGNINVGTSGNTAAGTCGSGTSTEMWNNGTTGKMNASLDFDGTDDVVTVVNDLRIQLSQGLAAGFTISSWVNAGSAGESNVGQIFNKGTNTWCRTDTPSGTNLDIECSLNLTTPASVNISSVITTGSWNHVAMSWTNDSDDEITVWVNGQNVGSSTNGVLTTGNTDGNALLIGGPTTANFDGQIDDVRMYSYEMTSAQIQRLYNEGAAVRFGPSTGSP